MLSHESILECKQRVARAILGQKYVIDRVLIGMLAVFLLQSVQGWAQEDSDGSWPREIAVPEGVVVVYQPQPEKLEGNKLEARAVVTMTTVGYGDKAPKTFGGRIVAIVWMIALIVFISSFTASISASLTAEKLVGKVRGLHNLPHVRVGSMAQSETLKWLAERGIAPVPFMTERDSIGNLLAMGSSR